MLRVNRRNASESIGNSNSNRRWPNKMKSMKPSATGIPWYRRDTYERCLAIFEDAADLPDTFDAWRLKAKQVEDGLLSKGERVVRAEIDPDTFVEWCAAGGFNKVDSEARCHFANLKAMEAVRDGNI